MPAKKRKLGRVIIRSCGQREIDRAGETGDINVSSRVGGHCRGSGLGRGGLDTKVGLKLCRGSAYMRGERQDRVNREWLCVIVVAKRETQPVLAKQPPLDSNGHARSLNLLPSDW